MSTVYQMVTKTFPNIIGTFKEHVVEFVDKGKEARLSGRADDWRILSQLLLNDCFVRKESRIYAKVFKTIECCK